MPFYFYRNSNGERGIKGSSRGRPALPSSCPHIPPLPPKQICPHDTSPRQHPKSLQLAEKGLNHPMSYDYRYKGTPYYPGAYPEVYRLPLLSSVRQQRRHDTTMSVIGDSDANDIPVRFSRNIYPLPSRDSIVGPRVVFSDPFAACKPDCIPLEAAARQLYSTIDHAITFFASFYRSFRLSTRDIRTHANKKLLNNIWQSKIRSSTADPDTTSAASPEFSFREHQHQVIHRLEQMLNSRPPALPAAASMVDASPHHQSAHGDVEYHDTELYNNQQLHHAAKALKHKMTHCYDEVKYAVNGMGGDYELAKLAISELKSIKQHLATLKKCWDKDYNWNDSDGDDSDAEHGQMEGQNNGQ